VVEWKGTPAWVVEGAFGEPAAGCWLVCVVMIVVVFCRGVEFSWCLFWFAAPGSQ
jgi:hypothetical protein